jgi:hypothetical protein
MTTPLTDSSASVVTSYGLDNLKFEFRLGKKFFFLPKCPYRLWGVCNLLFKGHYNSFSKIRRSKREADHSPASNIEVTNEWVSTSTSL